MTRRALWQLAALWAAVTAGCALVLDEPVARALAAYEPSAVWDGGIAALEVAAGFTPWPFAVVAVLVGGVVACLARPAWRAAAPAWLFVAGTYLTTRNLTGWLKLFTGRLRPAEWLARGGGAWLRDGGFSFPSGHVMLVAALVIPVAVVAPRVGRPLLVAVAFAMVARVAVGAHFLSDVTGAVALTCACAALWEPVRRLAFSSRAAPPPGSGPAARAARSPA